nr:hypothetical protein GCM10020093_109980 [Planobispora longispora]
MSEGLPPSSGSSPTLEDVARAAGVSRATVSRVINGIRNVDPAIQEAVRQAIAATGYVPNQAARSLVTRRTGSIALVVSGAGGETGEDPFPGQVFADPFFGRVAGGIVGFLRPRGVHPILMFAETDETRAQVLTYLRQGNADGAVLVSTNADDPLPRMLVDAGLPAVLFARPPSRSRSATSTSSTGPAPSSPPTTSSPGAAGGSPPSPAPSPSPPARTAWPASGTRWRCTATPTSRASRDGSPIPAARRPWSASWPNSPTSTASSSPTT